MNRLFALALILVGGNSIVAVSDTYLAGSFLGKNMYWEVPHVSMDSIGLDDISKKLWGIANISNSVNPAAKTFGSNGYILYRLRQPSALSVGCAVKVGYTVLVLSQWGGTASSSVQVNKPGVIENKTLQRVVSPYLWEVVDSVNILQPVSLESDYTVRIFFGDGGYCDFPGKRVLNFAESQIMGIQGFTVSFDHGRDFESVTMQRMVLSVYLVAKNNKEGNRVTRNIEKAMDQLGLNLSYKTPELIRISGSSQ